MSKVRVLIVDDSAAMRALFCDILEQAKGVEVAGLANNADEAREKIAELRPDVLTLDVEMPGMTGMEFLEELMSTKPMPVIMLSSIAQEGSGVAEKARQLGAVDVFPKPLHASPEEFNATVAKLGGIVVAAAEADLTQTASTSEGDGSGYAFNSDGRTVVLAASTGSLDALRNVVSAYPANCPATVVLLDCEEQLAERTIEQLQGAVVCKVEEAQTDVMLSAGTVYVAFRKDRHVVVEDDYAPILKLIERDPIAGFRPSADMLLASVARAGIPALGGLLASDNADGIRGLEAMANSACQTFVQAADELGPNSRAEAANQLSTSPETVAGKEISIWLLGTTNKMKEAA